MTFVVLALATFRLSNLLSWESGPFKIFDRFRYLVGVRYDVNSKPEARNEFARMILCGWCNTVWIALMFVVVYYIVGDVIVIFCMPFAVSGAAVLVNEIIGK